MKMMDEGNTVKQSVSTTLKNIREFLNYLERKDVINWEELENNPAEVKKLVQDLLSLDMAKFETKGYTTARPQRSSFIDEDEKTHDKSVQNNVPDATHLLRKAL